MKKIFTLIIFSALILSILSSCDIKSESDHEDIAKETQEIAGEESSATATEDQEGSSVKQKQDTKSEESSEINSESEETSTEEIDPTYALVSGTYVRDNKNDNPYDFFAITLYPDGTYAYYETLLSSHIGMGEYIAEGNIITIVDKKIPYYDPDTIFVAKTHVFKFEYRDGKLVFLASESDNFMYVNLPNGAEFERSQIQE